MTTVCSPEDIETAVGVSSRADTWLLLRNVESNGKSNRLLSVLKQRGSAHSDQVREFVLTDHGIELADVYVGPGGVLTGPAGLSQEIGERDARLQYWAELQRREGELLRGIVHGQAELAARQDELAAQQAELKRIAGRQAAWQPMRRRPGRPSALRAGQIPTRDDDEGKR